MQLLLRRTVVGAVALLALTTAACTDRAVEVPTDGTGDVSVDGEGESAASAEPWLVSDVARLPGTLLLADGSAPPIDSVDLSTARTARAGVDFEVLYDAAPQSQAWSIGSLALDPSGRVFSAKDSMDQYDGGAWLLEPSEVGLVENSTTFTAWPSSEEALKEAHPRQAYGASTDGTTAAWVETASTELGISNWRIFASSGGEATLIARSEDVYDGDLPVVDGDTEPLLANGRVYWATTVPLDGRDGTTFGVQVMSRAADASDDAVVEAAGATQPAVGDAGLYVVRAARDDPSIPDGSFTIDRADGHGASTPVLSFSGDPGTSAFSLVAAGNRVAFAIGTPADTGGVVVVLDLSSSTVSLVPLLSSGRGTTLALCGDRLTWTSANGSLGEPDNASIGVLNLSSGDLARVIEPDNFWGVMCAGDLLSWKTIGMAVDARGTPTVVRWTAE